MRFRLFLAFVLLSLATRWLCLAVDVLDVDETAHIVGSWEVLRGKLLYTDFVNNKPPLLYGYYSLAQFVFGRSLFAVHLFTVLITVPLTAFALASFYRYSRNGIIAGVLFLLYSASFYAHDMLSANTELLMMLPASWAMTRFRSEEDFVDFRKVAASGFLIGLALLFKYPVILWLFPVWIAITYYGISSQRSSRASVAVLIFLLMFSIPPALAYLYFAFRGGEQAMMYWLFKNNLGYSANPIVFREAAGRAFSSLVPFLLATGPLWWFSFKRPKKLHGSIRVLLMGLILFTIPAAFWGFRFYPHYFIPFYVPLALCSAPAVAEIWVRKEKWFPVFTACIVSGFMIANCILYFRSSVYQERNPAFRNVATRLKADACFAGATLFAWGYAPVVYYYAGLPAASRFVVLPQSGLTTYISGNLESVRGNVPVQKQIKTDHWNWLLSDLEKNHATYILDFSPSAIFRWDRYPMRDYPVLQEYVDKYFEKLDEVDSVIIYRRRGCS